MQGTRMMKKRHSSHTTYTSGSRLTSSNTDKSDIFVIRSKSTTGSSLTNHFTTSTHQTTTNTNSNYNDDDLDEIPVKLTQYLAEGDVNKQFKVNSDKEKELIYILKKASIELQEISSLETLDSNIKIIKTTIEEIFNNFHANIQDFESCKQRLYDIISKNNSPDVGNIKEFIDDVITKITSSKSSSGISEVTDNFDYENVDSFGYTSDKNTNTYTVGSNEDASPYNIYVLGDRPVNLQLKLKGRSICSEINIKHTNFEHSKVASAENINKIREKQMELERYVSENVNIDVDREIPIKSSDAKRNILMVDEETSYKDENSNYGLIYRFCSYFCKKFRRSI